MGDNSAFPLPARQAEPMAEPLPVVRLKDAWNSTHPWIFQRLVEKPAQRPKPGSIVDVEAVDGTWIGRQVDQEVVLLGGEVDGDTAVLDAPRPPVDAQVAPALLQQVRSR